MSAYRTADTNTTTTKTDKKQRFLISLNGCKEEILSPAGFVVVCLSFDI